MNNFDDFLRSKVINASVDNASSGWDALDKVLPAKKATGISKWAFALLLIGGLGVTAMLLNGTKAKSVETSQQLATSNNTSISNEINESATASRAALAEDGNTSQTAKVGVITNSARPTPTSKVPTSTIYENELATPKVASNSNVALGASKENAPKSKNVDEAPNTNLVARQDNPIQDKKAEEAPIAKEEEVKKEVSETPKQVIVSSTPAGTKGTKKVALRTPTRKDFHKGKFYATVSLSNIFSYRSFQLTDGAAPYVNKNYNTIRQNSEEMKLGVGATFALEYKLTKSVSFQGGISYNKIGYKSNYNFEITDKAVTDNSGRILGYENLSSSIHVNTTNNTKIEVLRIPVGFNYNLFLNQFMLFHFYVGGSQNILLNAAGNGLNPLSLEEQKITKADFLKTANEICLDLGVSIALSSKYAVGIDLYYNKWITNISKNKYENVTPFSPGGEFCAKSKTFLIDVHKMLVFL